MPILAGQEEVAKGDEMALDATTVAPVWRVQMPILAGQKEVPKGDELSLIHI